MTCTWRSSHIDEFLKDTRSAHLRLWITDHVDREWYLKSTNCRARARGQRLQQRLLEITFQAMWQLLLPHLLV